MIALGRATFVAARFGSQRCCYPAPSKAWDPAARRAVAPKAAHTVTLTIHLPEEAVLEVQAPVGGTLLETLEAADLGDVWEGGACGGACQCSTCRVVVVRAPTPLAPRSEDEEDMLDTAAMAAARGNEDAMANITYLEDHSRLACQLVLRAEDSGLAVELPDDVTNVLEVPLWLRGSR